MQGNATKHRGRTPATRYMLVVHYDPSPTAFSFGPRHRASGTRLRPAPHRSANDAAAGKTVFQRQCQTCHIDAAEGPKRLGPTLFGLVGRKTSQVEGFRYSEPNKNAGFVWTPEKLDEYLKNPRAVIPGTTMAFAGVRQDADRANLIEYLKTLK